MNEGTSTAVGDSSGDGTPVNGTATNFTPPTPPMWVDGFPIPDTEPPAAPQGLAANAGTDGIGLTWTANGEVDLAGYRVYRSATSPVPLTSPINPTLLTSPAYLDCRPAGTYYYVVTAVDTSANESSASNEVSETATPPTGVCGLQFNGTNQYVTFGPASGLGVTTFTVEAWFRRDGEGSGTSTGTGGVTGTTAIPILTKGRGESDDPPGVGSTRDTNWFLGIRNDTDVVFIDYEEGAGQLSPSLNHLYNGTTTIVNGTWYHVAATFDGSALRLYLNGVEQGSGLTGLAGRNPRFDSIQPAALGTAITVCAGYSTNRATGLLQRCHRRGADLELRPLSGPDQRRQGHRDRLGHGSSWALGDERGQRLSRGRLVRASV